MDRKPVLSCVIDLFDLGNARRISFIDVEMNVVSKSRVERKPSDFAITASDVVEVYAMEVSILHEPISSPLNSLSKRAAVPVRVSRAVSGIAPVRASEPPGTMRMLFPAAPSG